MFERAFKQSDVSARTEIDRDSISLFVRARKLPTEEELSSLARVLGVDADHLLSKEHCSDAVNDPGDPGYP